MGGACLEGEGRVMGKLGLTTDLGSFAILLRILSRHVGPYFSTCRDTRPWDEPSLPKCAH